MTAQDPVTARTPLPIVQFGAPVLRAIALEVAQDEVSSPAIQSVVDNMIVSLKAAGGIGLAAPQIGVSSRIVISKIPAMFRPCYGDVPETPLLVVINPEIVRASEEMRRALEACLSIRTADGGVYEGVVERPESVTVKGYDRNGKAITVQGDNLLARALQHEVDHLDGILFTDRIRNLKDLRIYYPVSDEDPVLERNTHVPSSM